VLSTLAYLAIARALSPATRLIDGLERMQGGDFAARLPPFQLRELDRIGRAANALAAKIEATLAERAELTRRLINSQEDERRGLARELHDEYGQNLAAVAALAASIEKSVVEDDPGLAREAQTIGKIAGDMIKALRGTLLRLRPVEFESFGLGEGLQQLVDLWNSGQHTGTRFALELSADVEPLPPSTAMHVFRIAQEGLTNAARHAQARNVDLRLEAIAPARPQEAAGIRLTIEDDGIGRRLEVPRAGGMGLLNMQERVAALGGSITFDDVPGGGLRVEVVVPSGLPKQESGQQEGRQ
jgi:signal transduction histidine kinase